jgi:hypothetical protein
MINLEIKKFEDGLSNLYNLGRGVMGLNFVMKKKKNSNLDHTGL